MQFVENKVKKIYLFFVDFKAAFDSVPRKLLFYKLSRLGLSSKFIKVIEHMYEDSKAAVWGEQGISEFFKTLSGVKQGCFLFPNFILDLP